MKLRPEEPQAGPWRVIPVPEFVSMVFEPARKPPHRPWVVAVDGRSGGGKTTLADRLQHAVPNSGIVHTDDVSWHHSFFGWQDLMADNILSPVHAGQVVRFQPPDWEPHGRSGTIDVPAGLDLLIIEGVGAARTELLPWIDRVVWVQSDYDEAERRGIERDGGTEEHIAFWHKWMAAEVAFLEVQRPWERAEVIVSGTPNQPYDRQTAVVVAPALK